MSFDWPVFQLVSQTEQVGGYWLIGLQMDTSQELPINAQLTSDDTTLTLFQQEGKQSRWIANGALSEKAIFNAKNNQAWCFLNDLEASLPSNSNTPILIMASDNWMATALMLSKQLQPRFETRTLLHASASFPFQVKPAIFMFGDFPPQAIGCCPLLEDWKIANRLCSDLGLPGCFDGNFDELTQQWTPPENWHVIDCAKLPTAMT